MATPDQLSMLQSWLEWAGGRLVALPSDRIKPSQYRTYWPDYSNDIYQVLEMRKALPVRALAPSAKEIDLMDEILRLPAKVDDHMRRRVVQMRLLVHPISLRHLRTWDKIAKAEHTSAYKVQAAHTNGLREIWGKTTDFDLNALGARFEQTLP